MENAYTQRLASINRIRETASKYGNDVQINLAQMVVIGDQSSGKSSLLTELTGIPFPSKSGITTKRPIVANTVKTSTASLQFFRIGEDGAQQPLADVNKDLFSEQTGGITQAPLFIRVEGKACMDLTLVDLPGIIHNGSREEDGKLIIDMIETYIEPEQTLIIIVSEASKDEETQRAVSLARKFDPDGHRTLRVFNKFDHFDSEESKARARKFIERGKEDRLGCHAVVCRPGGQATYDARLEHNSSWYGAPETRFGIQTLKDRLPPILSDLLQRNREPMREQVVTVIQQHEIRLVEIGRSAPSKPELIAKAKALVREQMKVLQDDIQRPIETLRQQLHDTKSAVSKELIWKHFYYDNFCAPFFQGNTTFVEVQEHLASKIWKPIVEKLIQECSSIFVDMLSEYDDRILKCGTGWWNAKQLASLGRLGRETRAQWSRFLKEQVLPEFRTAALSELDKECLFKTMNHYLTAKYEEGMALPEETISEILQGLHEDMWSYESNQKTRLRDTSYVRKNFEKHIRACLDKRAKDYKCKDLKEQTKDKILCASRAYWWVSHKNLGDNLLSVVDRLLLRRCRDWIENTYASIQSIANAAVESSGTQAERDRSIQIVTDMKKCLFELDSMM